MNDLKFAFRQLLKNPGYTAVAVLTPALGIGANTAIFQLLNAVRLKTLPVSKPQELIEVRIIGGNPGIGISDGANAEMTYPLWDQLQKQRETFSGIFAWSTGELPIGSGVETRSVKSLWTSGEFFSVLGVPPVRGRLFNTEDAFITLTRRNELGIRLALAARRGNILWLVIRHGLKLAGCGVAIGLAGALVLTRLLSGLLFGINPSDPATLVAISLLLIAVASLACWLPARRAARVDPMEALRYE